jgi:hypothetical protein
LQRIIEYDGTPTLREENRGVLGGLMLLKEEEKRRGDSKLEKLLQKSLALASTAFA